MLIPQANPKASYLAHQEAIDAGIARVVQSGRYILGEEVTAFEREFADYIGVKYAVGVANGTDALELICRGLGIGSGDIVATVPNTAVATVAAIDRVGAEVRFVDIEENSFAMSPCALREVLRKEPRIRAVIVVQLFGYAANMEELQSIADEFGISLIEDCAQAHGATYRGKKCGTFGVAAGFSFYPTKNLGALGDGGALVTSDGDLAERIRSLRQYGWRERYISSVRGVNSRLDEIQAVVLRAKLPKLDIDNRKRTNIAERYEKGLCNLPFLTLPPIVPGAVYHQYVVQCARRDELATVLAGRGIGTAIHYPVLIPKQPAYCAVPLPVALSCAEKKNSCLLSLPMYPELSNEAVDCVIGEILEVFEK